MKKVTAQELSDALNQAIEQTPGSEQFFEIRQWDELSDKEKALMAEGAWKLNLIMSEMSND
jgi:hypothetical protein